MQKYPLYILISLVLALVFLSCGSSSTTSSTSATSSTSTTPSCTGALCGVWSSACTGTLGGYLKRSLNFSTSTAATITLAYYADTACSVKYYGMTYSGTYTIGAAATSPSGATNLDYDIASLEVTPTSGIDSAFNRSTTCGKSSWSANQSNTFTTVTTNCFDFTGVTSTFTPGAGYTIFQITNNVVQFGDLSTSSSSRPSSLLSTTYTKQ